MKTTLPPACLTSRARWRAEATSASLTIRSKDSLLASAIRCAGEIVPTPN